MKCPNCDEEINDDSNFCRFCGFNLEIKDHSSDNNMFCHNCGKLIDGHSKICSYCGVAVEPIISIEDDISKAYEEYELNNFNVSIEILEEALEIDNQNKDVLFGLIKSFFKLQEYRKVIIYSYKFLKIDDRNLDVLKFKLESEINIKSFFAAKTTVNDLLDISGPDVDLLLKKISILENISENDELVQLCDDILSIDDERDDVYFKKSQYLLESNKYEDALKTIDLALNINKSEKYYELKTKIEKLVKNIEDKSYHNALDYFNEYNYSLANEILQEFSDINSLELRCECLYRLCRNDEALNLINCLLKQNRTEDYLKFNGKIYLAKGNKSNSLYYFNEAYKLDKNSVDYLAFAYGVFGEINLSKKYYSKMDNDLSKLWISYYENKTDLYISGIKNDFFNYPHACCLKVVSYFRKSISFLEEKNLSKTLHFLQLTVEYFVKLHDFIEEYNLNRDFVVSNFVYLRKTFYNLMYFKDMELIQFDRISKSLSVLLNNLFRYYDDENLSDILKTDDDLFNFYKIMGKIYLSAKSYDLALKYFKIASNYNPKDSEIWIFIGNLEKNNQIAFYNKALFCIENELNVHEHTEYLMRKAIILSYLNLEDESIKILKKLSPNSFSESNFKNYIDNLKSSYVG